VHPAAHYFVGGVRTDMDGRTDLPGLYACGEAAATGVHGANRLASNSLLEGLVFGARAAEAILADDAPQAGPFTIVHEVEATERGELDLSDIRSSLRSAMWRNVGVERSGARMQDVLGMFDFWNRYAMERVFDAPDGWEVQNLLTVGRLTTQAALARTESRGTHARSDARSLVRRRRRRSEECSAERQGAARFDQGGVQPRQVGEALFDEPVDLASRQLRGDIGHGRQRVHHVAQRRGLDNQQAHPCVSRRRRCAAS
jgi:aspartate oxidase